MNRTAVCPGSFDPITLGHVDIVKRSLEIFGSVEIVAMINPEKKYMFSLDFRFEMLRETFKDYKNVKVFKYSGMLYEYLQGRSNECVIVKGIRNPADFEYEQNMANFNFMHSGIETLFLPASANFISVSSTLVKERMMKKMDFSDIVPKNAVKFFQNKL